MKLANNKIKVTEVTVGWTLRQSHRYQSAEIAVTVTAATTDAVEHTVAVLKTKVRAAVMAQAKEQHALLRKMGTANES